MIEDFEEAKDEIFGHFWAAWQDGTLDICGYIPNVKWPNVESDKPDASKYWARVNLNPVINEQSTLRTGVKRYTAKGNVIVQIFAPRSEGEGDEKCQQLSEMVKKAFRDTVTSGNMWFRNSTIKTVEAEAKYYIYNVVADYQYDEQS